MQEIKKVGNTFVHSLPTFSPCMLARVSDKIPGERLFHISTLKDGTGSFLGGESGYLYIFDDYSHGLTVNEDVRCNSSIEKILINEDQGELLLFTGSGDFFRLNLHDLSLKEKIGRAHARGIFSARLDDGLGYLVTGSLDSSIKIWDSRTYQLLEEFHSRNHGVLSIFTSTFLGGYNIFTGTVDGRLNLWREGERDMVWSLKIHDGPVFSVVDVPFEGLLLTSGADGFINIIDVEKQRIVQRIAANQGKILDLVFLENRNVTDGRYFLSAGGDGSLGLWELDALSCTASSLSNFRGHSRTMEEIIVDGANSRVLTISSDGTFFEWKM
ncbi:MAG: hypothetical protein ACTSUE_07065 [Promethearchaeota archaeon]